MENDIDEDSGNMKTSESEINDVSLISYKISVNHALFFLLNKEHFNRKYVTKIILMF